MLAVPSRVIFNGARVEEFTSTEAARRENPYILAIGRLVPQKGFDVLLGAMAEDRGCLPSGWELLIAGDGPDEKMLRDLAISLGITDRVRFVGRADRSEVPRLMRGCEFVVVPSRADEGLPVVCAEAAAAGRAVIGTRRGGIPEIVLDGETGLIVPPESSSRLSSAIRLLAFDEAKRCRFGEAALIRSTAFAWQTIAQQYADVYRDALLSRN
jgi:phosphatidylinositol alpha-1,6-mannosyltransferase